MHENPVINPKLLLSVGKVIVAIAWADGEIQDEEVECLKSLLNEIPDIPSEYLAALESLLTRPIEPTEREIILDEFHRLITCITERNFALYWLDRIIDAKGKRDPNEMLIYDAIVNTFLNKPIEENRIIIQNNEKIRNSMTTPLDKAIVNIDTAFIESRKFIDKNLLSDAVLKRMLMIGVLATRITLADYRIDESEIEQLKDFIRRQTGLDKQHALQLACLILVYDLKDDSEVLALCQLLRKNSTLEERKYWVDQLLRISQQDGIVVDQEMNQIISIAAGLQIPQEHFQKALHSIFELLEV